MRTKAQKLEARKTIVERVAALDLDGDGEVYGWEGRVLILTAGSLEAARNVRRIADELEKDFGFAAVVRF